MNEAGKFFWNELMTPDVEGAKAFYGKLFGWQGQTTPMAGGRTAARNTPGSCWAACPWAARWLPRNPAFRPHWMPYIRVEDADAAEAAAVEAGGRVCKAAFDVPESPAASRCLQGPPQAPSSPSSPPRRNCFPAGRRLLSSRLPGRGALCRHPGAACIRGARWRGRRGDPPDMS